MENINVEYKSYDDKYEGWKVRPVDVPRGMQATINEKLIIRCVKFRSQLENKQHLYKIIEVLKKENLL